MLCLATLVAGCSSTASNDQPCSGSFCGAIDDWDDGKLDGVVARVPWGQAIEVVGAEAVVTEAIADLDYLAQTAVGQDLMGRLEAEAKAFDGRLTLRPRSEPDGEMAWCGRTLFVGGAYDHGRCRVAEWHLDDEGRVAVDQPGDGLDPSRIRVVYNRACAPIDSNGAPCAEPHTWLLHELIHALHAIRGELLDAIADPSDPIPYGSNHEEAWTVGRGAYIGETLSENALRRELGVPQRTSHASLCGTPSAVDGSAPPADGGHPDGDDLTP